MRVIPPITITPAKLTSSTVAEPYSEEPAWSSGVTYADGDVVSDATNHIAYESLKADNFNHVLVPVDGSVSAWWAPIGKTNKFRMFDLTRNNATTAASPLTVVITPGERFNAVALVGLSADEVEVTITVGGDEVYNHTEGLGTRVVENWYDHFFEPFSTRRSVALFDLPPYVAAVLTIDIRRTEGEVSCAGVIIGNAVYIGTTIHGAQADAQNYSKIERTEFGDATLLVRRTVPISKQNVVAEKTNVPRLMRLRDYDLNAVPAFWSGLDDQESGYFPALSMVGVYKTFSIDLAHPEHAMVNLEIEEI